MKLLYEASNTVEAHMILNLLEQAGLSARIDGEYLQGGVGELQAIGVVRVMVEEPDYPEARKIIDDWDAMQPREKEQPAPQKKSGFGLGLFGFILGAGSMIAYYQTPVTKDGIDYNDDGILDEKWTYVNYRISKTKIDRNLDGSIDIVYSFDRKGIIKSASSDEDFNGSFETDVYYKHGNVLWQKSDTTGDGFKDYDVSYNTGGLSKATFINPSNNQAIKIQQFSPFRLISAEVDTTQDGVMDTFYKYDNIEEITEKSNKRSQQDAHNGE